MFDDDVEEWLQAQPLDTPIDIDGDSVYLKLRPGGAELGAYLLRCYTPTQLQDALKQGFRSALLFDAGLGCAGPDAVAAEVGSWLEAAQPLENLLNQVSMWRAALTPARVAPAANAGGRNEQRLRMLFAGARP